MSPASVRYDAKLLYRRLDSLLDAFDPGRAQKEVLDAFLGQCLRSMGEALRLAGVALYVEHRDGFDLVREVGQFERRLPETLDSDVPPLSLVFQHRVYIFGDHESAVGRAALGGLPGAACAALVVGVRPNRQVLLFGLHEGWERDELDFALNTIRAALGARLMDERVRGSFKEAACIQQSLLVEEPPSFHGYEVAMRTVPADEVGGDFYDFHPYGDDMLGLAIGDASGHGLPAALLVRDVVTGLRMGLEKELKVAHVFGKLNRVIHRSTLSSRFVSVFYGELESNGNLIYVNAGHQPPLLFSREKVIELTTGGTVIGPLPEAQFRRGLVYLEPGDLLVLCTDGICERSDQEGEFFGPEGVRRVVAAHRAASAEQVLERVFAAAFAHGGERPWEDDATMVVVRRLDGVPPA